MGKSRRAYPPEFRQQMVELYHAGRSTTELSQDFGADAQSIRNWVKWAKRDAAKSGASDGEKLTPSEREELDRLRRENRQLRLEREILSKQRPGSLGRRTESHRRIPIREREPGRLSDCHHVPCPGCLLQRLLCVGEATAVATCASRRCAAVGDQGRACGLARHLSGAAHSRRA